MQSVGHVSETFPIPKEKMKNYIEERQNILNPCAPNKEFPNRLVPSPFAKRPKNTPTKRSHTESRCDIKKPRKGDKRCFQYQGSIQTRVEETVPQNPILTQPAVPILQVSTIGPYTDPVTATVPTQPATAIAKQPQQSQNFCALVFATGKTMPK